MGKNLLVKGCGIAALAVLLCVTYINLAQRVAILTFHVFSSLLTSKTAVVANLT